MTLRRKTGPEEPSHAPILEMGVMRWNAWRNENPQTIPNLFEASFPGADLSGANLSRADLRGAHFAKADLRSAVLDGADLYRSVLWRVNLSDATLVGADLSSSNLNGAILSRADLRNVNLRFARLAAVDVSSARLSGCSVYGCSIWNLKGIPSEQLNITITPVSEPAVTVDNIEMAQFIYLLLKNEKIRHVIDSITSKVVLILGRFTPERKAILDAIREALRRRDYVPVMFDFEKPLSRDLTETISTLAHMARFVIADITGARSIPQELQAIVPDLPNVPVQPLLLKSESEYGMFEHFKYYPWVLEAVLYENEHELLANLEMKIILPAEKLLAKRPGVSRAL
jgi:hypothetical protein